MRSGAGILPATLEDPFELYALERGMSPVAQDPLSGEWFVYRHSAGRGILLADDVTAHPFEFYIPPYYPGNFVQIELIGRYMSFWRGIQGELHSQYRRIASYLMSAIHRDYQASGIFPRVFCARDAEETSEPQVLIERLCRLFPFFAARLLGFGRDALKAVEASSATFAVYLDDPQRFSHKLAGVEVLLATAVRSLKRESYAPRKDVLDALHAWRMASYGTELNADLARLFLLLALIMSSQRSMRAAATNSLILYMRNRQQMDEAFACVQQNAVIAEEVLRYDGPVHVLRRVIQSDCSFSGLTLQKGQLMNIVIGSANRDEAAFPKPRQISVENDHRLSLSFGAGRRHCLGRGFAIAVLGDYLRYIMRRAPEDAHFGSVYFNGNPYLRQFNFETVGN